MLKCDICSWIKSCSIGFYLGVFKQITKMELSSIVYSFNENETFDFDLNDWFWLIFFSSKEIYLLISNSIHILFIYRFFLSLFCSDGMGPKIIYVFHISAFFPLWLICIWSTPHGHFIQCVLVLWYLFFVICIDLFLFLLLLMLLLLLFVLVRFACFSLDK